MPSERGIQHYVHYRGYPPISFPRYFTDVYLGLGVKPADWTGPSWPDLQFAHLWFIQNLLAYSVLYVLCRQGARLFWRRPGRMRRGRPVPGHRTLLWLTAAIAAATFVVRLRYPLGTWVPFLDFLTRSSPPDSRSTPPPSPWVCRPIGTAGSNDSTPAPAGCG
ncbi:hypothetical protein [Streptomyces sp. NPDC058086]|uniref:hypothetical protein n=1 Tax=Streptomyces sp. NPDC058086 TaxID=3346334 RepID=UPI0036E417E4